MFIGVRDRYFPCVTVFNVREATQKTRRQIALNSYLALKLYKQVKAFGKKSDDRLYTDRIIIA